MIYLIYGEDNYSKKEFLKKIKKNFGDMQQGINYIQIDADNVQNIISDIETPAFGFPKKLIVANDTGIMKKNPMSDKLAEYIKENNIDDVELVIIENSVEKNKLFDIISQKGTVKEINELKMPQLITKVKQITNAYGVNIQENTAQYFIECCGTNMEEIINEIRKLIEYAGKGGTITKEDIDSLTIKKAESIVFELTDNLGKKNIKAAIEVLHNLLYAKENIQKLLAMLYNHFKKIYIVQLSQGKNVAQNLKLKPNQAFLVGKYQTQARYFKGNEIHDILKEIIYLDEASKGGNVDINVGLESVLCKYCS